MSKLLVLSLVFLSVMAVAVADVLTKKVAASSVSFSSALRNPWMIVIVCLYVAQILVFTYAFVRKAELGVVGIIQAALYAIVVVGSGVLFFKERVSVVQGIGMVLAVLGVVLTNV